MFWILTKGFIHQLLCFLLITNLIHQWAKSIPEELKEHNSIFSTLSSQGLRSFDFKYQGLDLQKSFIGVKRLHHILQIYSSPVRESSNTQTAFGL